MTAAKALLSVWVGIDLILPGCICQLLAVFGIDHHHHGAAMASSSGEIPAVIEMADAPLDCHCDHVVKKIAEPCDTSSPDLQPSNDWTPAAGDAAFNAPRSALASADRSRAPPPDRWRSQPTVQQLCCVYLI